MHRSSVQMDSVGPPGQITSGALLNQSEYMKKHNKSTLIGYDQQIMQKTAAQSKMDGFQTEEEGSSKMPKNFVWNKGASLLFLDQTTKFKKAPNL